jgi:hypothetical protein
MQDDQYGETLSSNWRALHNSAGQAIEWIHRARRDSPTIANEAQELIHKLRQHRNQARKLAPVSLTGSTVGFFGLSQAGKSYLISALIAGPEGYLETRLDGQLLNFIDHVNPPGGGAEATGLVTRFSKRQYATEPGFPLQLQLFAEVDLVKVLVNSFIEDFNQQKLGFSFDGSNLEAAHSALREARTRKQSERVPGVTEDDVVELWDYLQSDYGGTIAPLTAQFLPELTELAPYLKRADRVKLFSFFWGRLEGFTQSFDKLTAALEQLNYATTVLAPLTALVEPYENGQGYKQRRDSIMNVTTLFQLDRDDDDKLAVCVAAKANQVVELSRAVLAALTVEILFPLENTPAQTAFNTVDILDFPGYRGRMKLESFAELNGPSKTGEGETELGSPIPRLILRGKVAYLFQRYTDMQEMNVLVICAASDKQSDVADVGPVLTRWVKRTQGVTAADRAKRQCGLIWAMTRMDLKIQSTLPNAESMFNQVWDSVVNITLTEKFSGCDWLGEWSPDQPFNTSFLVRKPGMAKAFITTENDRELGLIAGEQPKLEAMAQTWSTNATVQEYVKEPGPAWQAMMTLNDGGITRLSDYISQVAVRANKLSRLNEQLEETIEHLTQGRLSDWYNPSGADEVKVRAKRAKELTDELKGKAKLLGYLQTALLMPEERVRSLYLSSDYDLSANNDDSTNDKAASSPLTMDEEFGLDFDLDFTGDTTKAVSNELSKAAATGSDARFGKGIYQAWINHLSAQVDNEALLSFVGLPRRTMDQLTAELIIAMSRFDVESRLIQKVVQSEQSGTKREELVDRQVLGVQTLMGDFLTWLGQQYLSSEDQAKSQLNLGQPVFVQPPRVPRGALPPLGEKLADYYRQYVFDWLTSLGRLVIENAGFDAGRDISAELNANLGEILKQLEAAKAMSS